MFLGLLKIKTVDLEAIYSSSTSLSLFFSLQGSQVYLSWCCVLGASCWRLCCVVLCGACPLPARTVPTGLSPVPRLRNLETEECEGEFSVMLRVAVMLLFTMTALLCSLGTPASASAAASEPPVMRQMWMTPIQTSSVLELLDDLSSLRALAVQSYASFRDAKSNPKNQQFLDKDATLSDSFFLYQKADTSQCQQLDTAASECEPSLPARLRELGQTVFLPAAKKFLSEIYVDIDIPPSSKSFSWVSVHGNGTSHPLHHHKDSLVSAVLYLDVPPGSGDIVFHDPRGSLPPFGKTLRIPPRVGDFVLFPGMKLWKEAKVYKLECTTIGLITFFHFCYLFIYSCMLVLSCDLIIVLCMCSV